LIGNEDQEMLQEEQPKIKNEQMKNNEGKKSTALLCSHRPKEIGELRRICTKQILVSEEPYNKVSSKTKELTGGHPLENAEE